MKPRSLLSAAEVAELQEFLDRKLERIGIPSRPEVALRLLDLSSSTAATMKDFAEIIRVDHAMSGRVLRLANSPLFAQRNYVTNLDRACLVLGLERIKSISLGLQLSRAAIPVGAKDVSRETWGQSVYRACLASEAARVVAPAHVPEAFVIGLLVDAGIPLMCKLVGDVYANLYAECPTPGALYRRESETLGFTHVDVVTAMARRWRLPEMLARPIELHHARPTDLRRTEPVDRLHRVSYAVALLQLNSQGMLDPGKATLQGDSSAVTAQRLLGISEPEIVAILQNSMTEYSATIVAFSEVASTITDLEALIERVHVGLVRAIDDTVEQSIQRQEGAAPERVCVGGHAIEMIHGEGGSIAYLFDTHGQRLLAHRFAPDDVSVQSLCEAFGLELTDPADRERLSGLLRKRAA
jgi:HD-like signal output (HDOD) protein